MTFVMYKIPDGKCLIINKAMLDIYITSAYIDSVLSQSEFISRKNSIIILRSDFDKQKPNVEVDVVLDGRHYQIRSSELTWLLYKEKPV